MTAIAHYTRSASMGNLSHSPHAGDDWSEVDRRNGPRGGAERKSKNNCAARGGTELDQSRLEFNYRLPWSYCVYALIKRLSIIIIIGCRHGIGSSTTPTGRRTGGWIEQYCSDDY